MNSSAPRRCRPACLTLALLAGLGWLMPVPAGYAQMEAAPFGQGTHAFRRILHDFDLKPLASLFELAHQPQNHVLIVLGDTTVLSQLRLEYFIQLGGAALVATDRSGQGWYWRNGQPAFQVGAGLRIDRDSAHAFHKQPDCIEVLPVPKSQPQLFPKPTAPPVWTNRPASLSVRPADLPVLARLPPESFRRPALFPELGRPLGFPVNAELDFAVGGEWGKKGGRLLVLADHSIFINDMMLQPDTGNIDFTYNLLGWLTDNGKRTHVLLVEEGALLSDFDVPTQELPPPPLPPAEVMVPIIDDTLKHLQDENVLNQVALNVIDHMLARHFGDWLGPGQFLEALALLLTMSLISFGMSRLMRARHRLEVGTPLLENALARLTPSEALVEQRRQALLKTGNLWESARTLARQCLEAALEISAVGDRRGPVPPRIQVLASWWQRRRLERSWDRLWQLAYGRTPSRVSPRQSAQLLRQIDDVEAALADGVIQIERDETQASEHPG